LLRFQTPAAAVLAYGLDAEWEIRAHIFTTERRPKQLPNPKPTFDRFSVSPGWKSKTVDIYVHMQGQRRGPYEKAQLEEMWKRGQIPTDALYWHDDMGRWAVISELFADTIMPNVTATSASPDPPHGSQSTTTPN